MRSRLMLSMFVLALALAGCGSSSATGSSGGGGGGATAPIAAGSTPGGGSSGGGGGGGGARDMCSLLTQTEANTAAGGTLAQGAPQNDGQMCLWEDANNGQVSITLEDRPLSEICLPDMPRVDGIGDGACFLGNVKLATILEFAKGGQVFGVNVVQPNGTVDSIKAAEKVLALAAIGRM